MNKYEKAVEALKARGHNAWIFEDKGDTIVYLDAWNQDLCDTDTFRLHDDEITWWG
jgi:hypothetical protein